MTEIHGKLDVEKMQRLATVIDDVMTGVEIKPSFTLKECSESCAVLQAVMASFKGHVHTSELIRVMQNVHNKIKQAAERELANTLKDRITEYAERESGEKVGIPQQDVPAKASSDESSSN